MLNALKSISVIVMASVFILTLNGAPFEARAENFSELNVSSEGIAVKGYDLVSYFDASGPLKGAQKFAHTRHGAKYLFASAENLSLFKQSPAKYLPAYGGFCAYGVVLGKKFDISPDAWRIVDDVLFFQLDKGTQLVWEENREKNIEIGDRTWSSIQNIPANDL